MLKEGGRVVFFGELGDQSRELIRYFESLDAKPIELGDNPANWMLREVQEASMDYAEEYLKSSGLFALKQWLAENKQDPSESMKISYDSQFATTSDIRQKLMNKRLQKIYWRSPAYNLSRILVCVVIAFILGSVFLASRNPEQFTETEVRAWLAVTFLCFIIIGILSITSVLPVMLRIRDIFYRHRAAGMLDNTSLAWALGTAEKWFIVLSSFCFCLVFVGVSGLTTGVLKRSIRFWVGIDRTIARGGEDFAMLNANSLLACRVFSLLILQSIRISVRPSCAVLAACQRLKFLPAFSSGSTTSFLD